MVRREELPVTVALTGTPNQIELAEQIRPLVEAEFVRVALAFQTIAASQSGPALEETKVVLGILEEKRAEALAHESAGYFITTWRELSDQVRVMIGADPRFQAIRASRLQRATDAPRSEKY